MAIVSEASLSNCYDIKSADLSLVALVLKTTDIASISKALVEQMAESPGFFDQDPVIIDVSSLTVEQDTPSIDLVALLPLLREHGLVPLAILQDQWAAARFSTSFVPPCDRGMT